ncbi:MAG: hypothetical protein AW07_03528 [Candidatus Accumulibacter sp. SK-11]|nr:MAG: hypothetical protein AW07_03528 [Candidatus Accumulibacter sp. SK-11]
MQQLEQGQPDFVLFLGDQRHASAEGSQPAQQLMAVAAYFLESLQELFPLLQQGVIVMTQGRQEALDQSDQRRQKTCEQCGGAAAVRWRSFALVGGCRPGPVPGGDRDQRLLNALPTALADRRLECREVLLVCIRTQSAERGHELAHRCLGKTGDVG